MARLILEFEGERREIRLAGPIIIGRSSAVAVFIDHRSLSREHARIEFELGRYVVRDLGSKNGTYLNGDILTQPSALRAGDRIRVGPATFTFAPDPDDTVPAPKPAAPPAPEAALPRIRRSSVVPAPPPAILRWAVNLLSLTILGGGTIFFHAFFTWTFQRFLP